MCLTSYICPGELDAPVSARLFRFAAEAVWRSMPTVPTAGSTGPQSQAGSPTPVPDPATGRASLGSPAGPAHMWTGSTRSLLPALRPGQSAEVPLQVCYARILCYANSLTWL